MTGDKPSDGCGPRDPEPPVAIDDPAPDAAAARNPVPRPPRPCAPWPRPAPAVPPRTGLIALFARHPTAANLLMLLMLISGGVSLASINTQFFPDFGIEVITVTVDWPGATADDIDQTIVQAIEPAVRFLDNVKRVVSSSYEGLASVTIAYDSGSDMQAALSDVETAVSLVTTLPDDAGTPAVRRFVRYDTISRLVISGPYPESSLKAIAKNIRDALLARGVDKVDIFGGRDEEIRVEVPPATLRQIDLTLSDIADRIRATSQDVPSGDIGNGERQIRSLGLLRDAAGIAGIEIKALKDGRKLTLRDIATVTDTFEDGGATAMRNGQPAIELNIQRAVTADALDLAATVDSYLAEVAPTFPPNLVIEKYDVFAQLIIDRIDLLLRNGLSGLVLVIAILFIFLNGRVAFWVMVGIPVSLLATVAVMLLSGQTINMVSLFGLILAIGIVVDDAIVVGEHSEARSAAGLGPLDAAISGAQRMAPPVLSSSLTTVAAFLPLFVIQGVIGDIIRAIPLVVVTVILASLVECFIILPGHLREGLGKRTGSTGWFARYRRWFDRHFSGFRDGPYRRAMMLAIRWRYATLALAFGGFILCIGALAGGRVGFSFFPSPESSKVYADVEMVAGTTRQGTLAMLRELDRAVTEAAVALDGPDTDLIVMSLLKLGTTVSPRTGGSPSATDTTGGLILELQASDQRTVRTQALINAWRAAIRPVPGLDTLTLREAVGGPPGRDVDVRLIGGNVTELKAASDAVKALLNTVDGVHAVADDLPWGKPETILAVTPRGRALDFTTRTVGQQVRHAIEGAIARRFPRGDEEITVRVHYPRDQVDQAVLTNLYLRAPDGREVPLSEVVAQREDQGFARIRREDGDRQVAVTADIDKAVTTTGQVIERLEHDGIAAIADRYGLDYVFKGKAEEQAETFGDMRLGAILGLGLIYIVLAWVFASYTRPLAVMMAIPLGFTGAVLGHYLMGYALTILSMVALIGLSGIVINDSIVLVSTIDERRRHGQPVLDAIVDGSCDRLRAVILTSVTTIGGLTPLMFETSTQAQFLIPMAVTITFGLAVATVLVLVVVPALMAFLGDVGWLRRRAMAVLLPPAPAHAEAG